MFNRLWVRFSLIFVGTMFLVFLSGVFLRSFVPNPPILNEFDALLVEIEAAIGPDRFMQLEEAFLRGIQVQIITTIVGAGVVGVLAGIFLSRWLVSPLQQLEKAASSIQERQYEVRVEERGGQELAAVAKAFNEMAERLGEAESLRRHLLSDVAHELRHPVHILQGNLQAMLDGVYPTNEEELSRLMGQTRHLNRLVNDLHELAQAEARQLPLNMEQVPMAELVKETTQLFQPTAKTGSIHLQAILEGELPTLELDRGRMKQVLSNLLNNALKYTPAGGHITVTLTTNSDNVTMVVADDGSGIAADDLPKIFDRFYRADSARRRDGESTGLGLAIVKAIVQAHDGDVEVASAGPDQGSQFTVTLPR